MAHHEGKGIEVLMRVARATADFESRSPLSLQNAGTWKYSRHPQTEILCLAYRLPHWREGKTEIWHPAFPHLKIEEGHGRGLEEFLRWVEAGNILEAHNAFFEKCIWDAKKPDWWPKTQEGQWWDSAAKAAAHALPRSLDGAAAALRLPISKDLEGRSLMKGLSPRLSMVKPRRPLMADIKAWGQAHKPCRVCQGPGKVVKYKKNGDLSSVLTKCVACDGKGYPVTAKLPEMPLLYHEGVEQFERLWEYCQQDVLVEEAVSLALPDLSPSEQQLYALDQVVNERGFQLDEEAVKAALALIDEEFADLNAELRTITGGVVEKATQRQQMLDWLASQGLVLDDTQASTLDEILSADSSDYRPPVRRAVEIMRTLGRSSTAKYERMEGWAGPDWRVRGGLLFHGASTGRWTGKGIQPHNFPRSVL